MIKSCMKNFLFIIIALFAIVLTACTQSSDELKFLNDITNVKSYKVEGVIESYYETGSRQNNFKVLYKNPEFIKVEISSGDSKDKQIIIKNVDGVYVLIPGANKTFKVQSSWPLNASHPYLMQSLAKDIANDKELIKTEDEKTYTLEVKTKLHANAGATKQKIIFDKETNLPKEVLIYDENSNLHAKVNFTNIELDYNVSDDEFKIDHSMDLARDGAEGGTITFNDREIKTPTYFPEGCSISTDDTVTVGTGDEIYCIMKFTGEVGFTLIQEYINDSDVILTSDLNGEIYLILGNIGVLKSNSIEIVNHGIKYTIASNDITMNEMARIVASLFVGEEK